MSESMGSITAATLSTFDIFKDVSDVVRENIAAQMYGKSIDAGNFVFSRSQKQKDVYFLISGVVQSCAYSLKGRLIEYEKLSAGRFFGEIAAIDQGERTSDCIAITDSEVAIMPRKYFLQMIYRHSVVLNFVLLQLTSVVRRQMRRVYECAAYKVNERVAIELVRLASSQGNRSSAIVIENPPTHAEIAARISCDREPVTRVLNSLHKEGIITWTPSKPYVIHDIVALTKLAFNKAEVM